MSHVVPWTRNIVFSSRHLQHWENTAYGCYPKCIKSHYKQLCTQQSHYIPTPATLRKNILLALIHDTYATILFLSLTWKCITTLTGHNLCCTSAERRLFRVSRRDMKSISTDGCAQGVSHVGIWIFFMTFRYITALFLVYWPQDTRTESKWVSPHPMDQP